MDPRTQLDEIVPLLSKLVTQIEPAQMDAATPCATFTVRNVLEHMVGGATMFSAAFRGESPDGSAAAPVASDDLAEAFHTAMGELRAAVHAPGAMERTIDAPFGQVPGDTFARFVALDGLVHGWDIATATGHSYDPPAEVVAAVDAFGRQAISDDMRDGDTFAAATTAPADASPLVQLVAFTGRQV